MFYYIHSITLKCEQPFYRNNRAKYQLEMLMNGVDIKKHTLQLQRTSSQMRYGRATLY